MWNLLVNINNWARLDGKTEKELELSRFELVLNGFSYLTF